ncbi:hypothetical protein HT105_22295, partial [Bacteroides fragilis]|nr:hypothetical protein [Bacteroides fragilis]
DAGDLLPRLHKIVRADCTTRNEKKARRLQRTYVGKPDTRDTTNGKVTSITTRS